MITTKVNNWLAPKGHINEMEVYVCKSHLPHGFPHVSTSRLPNYVMSHYMETSMLVSKRILSKILPLIMCPHSNLSF